MVEPADDPLARLHHELAQLRDRVGGVRGCVVGGVDGLFHVQDGATGQDPHDLAALAAATYGIGRQTGHVLNFGPFHETTIHNGSGYFVVYAVNDSTLLAIIGQPGLNVARLHLEFRECASRLDQRIRAAAAAMAYDNPRL